MIKILGITFFSLVGIALVAIGLVQHQPAALGVGGMTFLFVLVLVLGSTLFRKQMDTKESGEIGMKVIKKAVAKAITKDGA